MRGPSFATACFTYKLSRSTSRPFSVLRKFALSIADCNSLPTVAATRFLVNASLFRGSSTRRPLIRFSTSRAFCGETRMYRASARNSIVASPRYAFGAAGTMAPGPPGTPAGLTAVSVAAFIECPLNCRVKLNSPSLCPTMFSVTYTGMNFLPLCTAIVCPTISGIIVERRDHVRSTFFSLRAFMASTFVARYASTNGPFFVERAIKVSSQFSALSSRQSGLRPQVLAIRCSRLAPYLTFLSPVHNKRVGPLIVPRLVATRRLAPRRHRMTSAGSLAFTAAMRMVHRVHRNAAVMRTLPCPARASRLAPGDVFVVRVSHLPNRRQAVEQHLAGLARRQLHQAIVAFFCDQLRRTTRRAHHLRALARTQFHIVNRRARRNIPQRQRVAHQNVCLGSAQNLLPNLQPIGLHDVTLLAIGVAQQGNAGRAARIVFDRLDRCRNPVLVPLEVNRAQLALVPAAPEPHGRVAGIAPPARPQLPLNQRLVRLLRRNVVGHERGAIAQRLRCRSVGFNRHISSQLSALSSFCHRFSDG